MPVPAAAHPAQTDVRPGDQAAVDQVEDWFRAWHASGDPAIRERIILAHLRLAERIAARFRPSHHTARDDLVQSARVGLVTAVNRYDPRRSNPFIVYAIVCITGEVKRYLRDTSWRLHVARSGKERALRVVRATDELTSRLGRCPTAAELAGRLGLQPEEVGEALAAIGSRVVCSLDRPAGAPGGASIGALLAAPPDQVDLEDRLALPGLLAGLPEVERRAVVLRFFGDLNQDEIGARLGYSQMHVSRLLRHAVTRMREQLER